MIYADHHRISDIGRNAACEQKGSRNNRPEANVCHGTSARRIKNRAIEIVAPIVSRGRRLQITAHPRHQAVRMALVDCCLTERKTLRLTKERRIEACATIPFMA
jgi:hypothetical protein